MAAESNFDMKWHALRNYLMVVRIVDLLSEAGTPVKKFMAMRDQGLLVGEVRGWSLDAFNPVADGACRDVFTDIPTEGSIFGGDRLCGCHRDRPINWRRELI